MKKQKITVLLTAALVAALSPAPSAGQAADAETNEVVRQWKVPLPSTIRLTEEETLYEAPDRGSGTTGSVSPQEVYVQAVQLPPREETVTMETQVWVEIGTWLGGRWIEVPVRELGAAEEPLALHAALLKEEVLYGSPDESDPTGKVLTPQTVRMDAVKGLYYRVQTTEGPGWIRSPGPSAVYRVRPGVEQLTLSTVTPVFRAPQGNLLPSAELSPQTVTAFESTEDGWYHIETWMGPLWLHPKLSMPEAIVKTEETAVLRNKTLYMYPNAFSKKLSFWAEINPARIYERSGPWAHVTFGHYDGWVYETTPTEEYTPPDSVKDIQLQPDASEIAYGRGSGWDHFPLSVRLVVQGPMDLPISADSVQPYQAGFQAFESGRTLSVGVEVTNLDETDVRLPEPATVTVEVFKLDGMGTDEVQVSPVWSGSFAIEPGTDFPGGKPEDLLRTRVYAFQWDQRDSNGVRVPPGTYSVKVKPLSYKYKDAKGKLRIGEIQAGMRSQHTINLLAPE